MSKFDYSHGLFRLNSNKLPQEATVMSTLLLIALHLPS